MPRRMIVGVMGSGGDCSEADRDLARELGEGIARAGWVLLSGGRNAGIMSAVNEGAKSIDGSVTLGILPDSDDRGISPHVDIAVFTGLGSARNNVNVLTSDVVIACGAGGPGTVAEIALAIKARKPVILLRPDERSRSFFSDLGGSLVEIAETAGDAVELAKRLL